MLDGEAVVFDGKGRSDFGVLQAALKPGTEAKITLVVFDLLHLGGMNLRQLPLTERLTLLDGLLATEGGRVWRSRLWPAESGSSLFKEACKLGLEGIISKKLSRSYAPGLRDWAKSKCRPRQEFIVCGYLPPKSSLPSFSSLMLGTIDNGKLVPRGKVGTGFSDTERRDLLKNLEKLRTSRPAFKIPDREVIWVKPEMIAEVEYAEITRDGSVRQASFIAMRDDKGAADVHLEGIQSATAEAKDAKVAGITISHPDRVVYPDEGIAKMEVARYPQGKKPDMLIWDLDPDASVVWTVVLGAAFLLRDFLAERGLTTMVKTSGGKGLHILLPLKPSHGWDALKEFTKQVAIAVAALNPAKLTTVVSKKRRVGKIFIDYLRNGRGATCTAPWSPRARAGAPVSMPINWADLPTATSAGFTLNEPPQLPEEWRDYVPQKITGAHLKEFCLV